MFKSFSNTVRILLPLVAIVLLLIFRNTAAEGVGLGLRLFADVLFPALFPFSVVILILVNYALPPFLSKLKKSTLFYFTVLVGIISGYPVGATVSKQMTKNGCFSADESQLAFALSSFCSPAFMLSVINNLVGNGVGYVVALSHYVSSFVLSFVVLKKRKSFSPSVLSQPRAEKKPFFLAFQESVVSAADSMLVLCGYIVIFSVIVNILPQYLRLPLSVLLELSNGTLAIAQSELSLALKAILLSFSASFGGLCVVMQIVGIAFECNVPAKKIIIYRICCGIMSSFMSFLLVSFIGF